MAAGHDHGADKHAVNRRRLAIAFAIIMVGFIMTMWWR